MMHDVGGRSLLLSVSVFFLLSARAACALRAAQGRAARDVRIGGSGVA